MYRKSIEKETTHADLKRAVEAWYEEIKYTTADVIKKYKLYFCLNCCLWWGICKFLCGFSDSKYGHFTQVVWADTQYVGCGRTIYGSSDSMNVLIICNYAIAGKF